MTEGEIVSAVIGAAALTFAVLAWLAARKSNHLATERSDVRWEVRRADRGSFTVANVGKDSAYEVTVEAWDRHDIATETSKRIDSMDSVGFVLPTRQRRGPDPTDVPKPIAPEPPRAASVELLPEGLKQRVTAERTFVRQVWEAGQESYQRMVREAEEEQVQVRVLWRSKGGRWSEWTDFTG